MKLSLADARKLYKLREGETIPSSQFRNALSALLREEDILQIRLSGSRATYYIHNPATLDDFLFNHFNVENLSLYIETLEKDDVLRADLVRQGGDSKIRAVRSFKGFCVNSYQPLEATLNGKPLVIEPVEGSFLFISDFETFVPAPEITIVGIENPENFRYIRQQAYLFEEITPLFVCRYPQTQSKDLVRWLASVPNRYLHFGDFDPAGLMCSVMSFYPICKTGDIILCHSVWKNGWQKETGRDTIGSLSFFLPNAWRCLKCAGSSSCCNDIKEAWIRSC